MCSDIEFFRPLQRRLAATAALVMALLPIAGCGHKAAPEPPPNMAPQAAQDITVQQRGHQLRLEFGYPQVAVSGLALPGIEAVEVWSLVTPVPETLLDDGTEPAEEEPGEASEGEPDEASEGKPDEAPTGQLGEPMESVLDGEEIDSAAESVPEESITTTEGESELENPMEGETGEGEDEETEPTLESQLRADPREFAAAAHLIDTREGPDLLEAIVGDRIFITLDLEAPLSETLEVHNLAVRTISTDGRPSPLSKHVALIPREPPAAPEALASVALAGGIELTWTVDAEELTGLRVFRREIRSAQFDPPLARIDADAVSYVDQTAVFGHDYAYSITAVSQDTPLIESALATPAIIRYEDLFPPTAPRRLVALAAAEGVRLLWESVAAEDVAGYVIYRQERGTEMARITEEPVTEAEFIDSGVSAGKTYTYMVRTIDEAGNLGPPSETVDARP